MITAVLLALAVAGTLATMPVRGRLAADPIRPDRALVRLDVLVALIDAALLAGAALAAQHDARTGGAVVVTGQVLAVAAAAVTGGPAVRVVLAAGGIPTRSENYDDPATEPLLRGGRVIGLLERTAVAVCLLLAWPAGIAVILGVKGLARFPQLREHHASEQFILGTFASVLWACAAAGAGVLLGR